VRGEHRRNMLILEINIDCKENKTGSEQFRLF
jgi:hypothetical protein